jgi:flagellar protein FliO/FliZ
LIELALRIGFSLLVVFGLMWGLARLVRRPLGGSRSAGALAVLNRQQLSRGSSVTVVKVADRALVLGVTDQQVSVLGETDLASFEEHAAAHEHRAPAVLESDDLLAGSGSRRTGPLDGSVLSPRTWRSMLEVLRDRTVRH